MAILKIARMGHPVLLARAAEVEDVRAAEGRRLLADMVATLKDAGGVGLAAPQVFASVRLFIFYVPESRAGSGGALPLTAVFNPVVTPLDEDMALGWEGCLSIPGLRAAVPRYKKVRLSGLGIEGEALNMVLEGFAARVVQHEADHLDGVMYPMRMRDFRYFGFNEEMDRNPVPLPGEVL
ncbi:peptide deformylase [Acidocella sp.]|uniref:peptide deformylase n=1 Tax=Acidocella sp. TaxID=50710 RepID=UPI002634E432|nr:peptide deformylase [Acidocella sp.]MDD2796231.1 peptide deformylase [Acidocella sp.]